MTSVALAAVALVVGALIGAVGIGGVLLVPALMALGALTAHEAAATSLATFFFTGLLGTWLFQRKGSIDWPKTALVCVAAVAFSAWGAVVAKQFSALVLVRIIAVLIIFAGAYIFVPPPSGQTVQRSAWRERVVLLAVGAAAGFGSGLSGAGGPLFSVPLMLVAGFPPLLAVGTSQVLQIVSAGAGTLANWHYGVIDWQLGALTTVFELMGVMVGVRIAHAASTQQLKKGAAILCLMVGTLMGARTL